MSEHIWRIYRYYNPIEDKSYVGQTTWNVNDRAGKNGHRYHIGTPFRNAIDKYGWDTFEQSILRLCTSQEEADYWEKFYIQQFNSIDNGYNTQIGGGGGQGLDTHWKHSDTARHKISISQIGNHLPEDTKKKISESMSGEKHHRYGKTWYNNGTINICINMCTDTVPVGFVKGQLQKRRNK